jgi:polyisoprenoid-binding protein YceI
MRFRTRVVVAAVAGLAALAPLTVDAALRSTGAAAVQFLATGNHGVRVLGRSNTLWVSDNGHMISVQVPLASLHTGVGLRDSHMRNKYLQASQYPAIRLDVPWAVVRRPPPGGTVSAEAMGMLHLHGQTRTARFHYTAQERDGVIAVVGTFRVDIREFGIQQPHFLGVWVNPFVDAEARFQLIGAP